MTRTILVCDFCGKEVDKNDCDNDVQHYRCGIVSFGVCEEILCEFDACNFCRQRIAGTLRLLKAEIRKENKV